jgi:hypothetical protein
MESDRKPEHIGLASRREPREENDIEEPRKNDM